MKKGIITLFFMLSAGIASAGQMYAVTGTPVSTSGGYGDAAISFQVSNSIEVTALSFFGLGMSSGDKPWVQLWNDDTDTKLGSVSWDAGVSDWNSKDLSSAVTLTPGVNYQIQSHAYSIPRYADSSAFTFGSEFTGISFQHDRLWYNWVPLNAPASSSKTITTNLPAMMNLTYTVIPEPSTIFMALMGFGLIGLSLRRRK